MGRGPSWEGVKLKIDRAAEHLEVLHQEVEAYLDDRPYEVVSEPRPRATRFYSARFINTLLYGSASSWETFYTTSGRAWTTWPGSSCLPKRYPRGATSFPLFAKRREYKRFKQKNYTPTGIVGEVHEEAANLVAGFQPYNNDDLPREHPL